MPYTCPLFKLGLGALDQQVTLELSDGIEDVHGQLAGRTGQINPQGSRMSLGLAVD
jgi:hypothetical protein